MNKEEFEINLKKLDQQIIQELCQAERYPPQNIFHLTCKNKEKISLEWIKEKSKIIEKNILWIADKSLPKSKIIQRENEEQRLIDEFSLPNNFLLVFLPYQAIETKYNVVENSFSNFSIDFINAYGIVIDENCKLGGIHYKKET